jgi:hypothetical protein
LIFIPLKGFVESAPERVNDRNDLSNWFSGYLEVFIRGDIALSLETIPGSTFRT